jgi:7-cyano-7-deazaguanine reductase
VSSAGPGHRTPPEQERPEQQRPEQQRPEQQRPEQQRPEQQRPEQEETVTEDAGLTHLGAAPTPYRYQDPSEAILEAFPNPAPEADWAVALDCPEFTSLCPITGQPDFGRLRIQYVPDRLCVESKSLKLYLFAYRNHGAFHEACVNRVADDLASVLGPRYLRVFGDFNRRGGISILPLAVRAQVGASEAAVTRWRALLDEAWNLTTGAAR